MTKTDTHTDPAFSKMANPWNGMTIGGSNGHKGWNPATHHAVWPQRESYRGSWQAKAKYPSKTTEPRSRRPPHPTQHPKGEPIEKTELLISKQRISTISLRQLKLLNKNQPRRMYVPLRIQIGKRMATPKLLFDTGSQVSILTVKTLQRLDKNWREKLKLRDSKANIVSYSNHKVDTIGETDIVCQWLHSKYKFKVRFEIKDDSTEDILGDDVLDPARASRKYEPELALQINYPPEARGETKIIIVDDNELTLSNTKMVQLNPEIRCADINLNLPSWSPFEEGDMVIATQHAQTKANNAIIIPSRSKIEIKNGKKTCRVRLMNTAPTMTRATIRAELERDEFEKIPIPEKITKSFCQDFLNKNKLIREVIISENKHLLEVELKEKRYLTQIKQGGAEEEEELTESDIEDTLLEQAPHIPLNISNTVEEAVKIESFDEKIQPYIRDLFLVKYRNVCSLHSLDAGNLSRTLGFVYLRLKPGAVLPTNKRIYKLNNCEANHLFDILSFLQKTD